MFFAQFVFAQAVGIRTDRDQILIGEKINLQLLVELPGPGNAVKFNLPDTLPHFELIEEKKFDTLRSGEKFILRKEITLTSFDSGSQLIPSFPVEIGRGSGSKIFNTKAVPVEVGYMPADSTGQLRDIKPVMGVEVEDYFWLYVAAVVVGVLILSFFLYRYLKNRASKPKPVFQSHVPAFEEALKSLDALQWKGSERQEVQAYYDQLSLIFKRYFSREKNTDLLSKTTGDILLMIKKETPDFKPASSLADALRGADAVKFAKFIPEQSLALDHKIKIREVIQALYQLKQKSSS